jgi:hypothetical protein
MAQPDEHDGKVPLMKYAFFFGAVAVTVRHWYEPSDEGDERGSRVEVQHLTEIPPVSGSLFAARTAVLGAPIFRADLFTHIAGEPGNHSRAHYHSYFIRGNEPCDRQWDSELQQDPTAWIEKKLSDLRSTLAISGATAIMDQVDYGEVRKAMPAIIAAVEACYNP